MKYKRKTKVKRQKNKTKTKRIRGGSEQQLDVFYNGNKIIKGQQLSRQQTLTKPTIQFKTTATPNLYTIIMWDPDVPSQAKPAWAHMVINNMTTPEDGSTFLDYAPPTPPSGIHRYFFTLYKQTSSINQPLISNRANFDINKFVTENQLIKVTETYIKVATHDYVGGKAGKLQMIYTFNDNSSILGAGNFGVVLSDTEHNSQQKKVVKILYDINSCDILKQEGEIQKKAYTLLKDIINVPYVYDIFTFPTYFRDQKYLCGLVMDHVPNPEGFINFEDATNYNKDLIGPVHMLLGYDQDDIETVWGKSMAKEVSKTNPSRGYHAGPEMLEAIWEDENMSDKISIDDVAYIMGKSISALIDGGIVPLDLEWIYGGNGKLYLIDFGLCEYGSVNKNKFLNETSSRSLAANYYVPKKGMRGYNEFLNGYWSDTI